MTTTQELDARANFTRTLEETIEIAKACGDMITAMMLLNILSARACDDGTSEALAEIMTVFMAHRLGLEAKL